MNNQQRLMPRVAVRSTASGLILMAVFTALWACIANAGLNGRDHHFVLIVFCLLAITFVTYGVYLFNRAKEFPEFLSDQELAVKKRTGKWFGIIFAAEGLGIFIAVNIVTNIGRPELAIPAIALVVGLHFYPMARLFKRNIDYYLATWTCIIAICAMLFTINKTLQTTDVLAFTGIGLAISTSCYGFYMIYKGRLMK